jgi:hypothetical protein
MTVLAFLIRRPFHQDSRAIIVNTGYCLRLLDIIAKKSVMILIYVTGARLECSCLLSCYYLLLLLVIVYYYASQSLTIISFFFFIFLFFFFYFFVGIQHWSYPKGLSDTRAAIVF